MSECTCNKFEMVNEGDTFYMLQEGSTPVIVDPMPISGSPNLVSSGGIYTAIEDATETDPTLAIAGMAADAAATGELKTEITGITEGIESATVNPAIDRSVNGVTVKESNGKLMAYGTATKARNYCCLNGQDIIKTSSDAFAKTLDAGTYLIETDATGYQSAYSFRATYTTFASAFVIANTDSKNRVVTFTAPVMIGLLEQSNRNYGTEENPTYFSFSAKRIIAKDPVAREAASNAVKYAEQSLTDSEAEQARTNIDGVGNDTLYAYNFYDAIKLGNGTSGTSSGITYTRNDDGTWTINGTAAGGSSGASFKNIISSSSAVPRYIVPGRKYKFSFNGGTVPIRVYFYRDNVMQTPENYSDDFEIAIPLDVTGIIVRFQVPNGTTISNETVKYTFIPETVTSVDNYYTYNTTVQKTEQIYNNTYNQTVSPTITTDTNGWLQAVDTDTTSETGKTDMAPAITAMLNSTGYCHLGEGIFYVSGNIDMPDRSTLCGCGDATTIRLLSSVATGYAVKMQKYCTIKDISFSGSPSAISPEADDGRDAIHFTANWNGEEGDTEDTTRNCMIDNVWIRNFSGSGIYCHNTNQSVSHGLYATNMYINACWTGINIDYVSEFLKFTNIFVGGCYYGCINNGGNNVFTACTFHARYIAFYIDGTKENAGHGTINGCTFCHIGSNNGTAISISSVTPGFVIANCQFWYGAVEVTDSMGILFDGCMFGRGRASDRVDNKSVCASISVSGGNLVLFSGCMFHLDEQRPPKITITNNTKTIFSGCYGAESGLPITA